MSRISSFFATLYQLPVEAFEATRTVLRRPKALLTVMRMSPPLPKECLTDPDLVYIYPAAYIHWSRCMHGMAPWEGAPVLSYGEYVAQMEILLGPTDVVIQDKL